MNCNYYRNSQNLCTIMTQNAFKRNSKTNNYLLTFSKNYFPHDINPNLGRKRNHCDATPLNEAYKITKYRK